MSAAFHLRGDILSNSTLIKSYEKDAEGYSRVPLGEFNGKNVHGDFYPAEDAVPQLEGNSKIANDLKEGTCYGEIGHPPFADFDIPGVNQKEALARWFARLSVVKPTLVSHHIRSIDWTIDGDGNYRNRNNKVRVWGWVKPFGPYEKMCADSIATPSMNTYFSVRSLCKPTPDGAGCRIMNMYELYTYDLVLRGGYKSACKWKAAPGLEDNIRDWSETDFVFRIEDMERARLIADTEIKIALANGAGIESRNVIGEMDRVIDAIKNERLGGEPAARFLKRNSYGLWKV